MVVGEREYEQMLTVTNPDITKSSVTMKNI